MPDAKRPIILLRTFPRSSHAEIFINEMIEKGYVLMGIKVIPDAGYYVLMEDNIRGSVGPIIFR